MIIVDATLTWVWQEGDLFVGHCPAFDFYSQGRSFAEAVIACRAGVVMLLDLARNHGLPLPNGMVLPEARA